MLSMNTIKVTNIGVINTVANYTNEYNSNTCNNGGGYRQYAGTVNAMMLDGNKDVGRIKYVFEDYSCEEFGTRYGEDITITDVNGNVIYNDGVNYGSMIDEPDDPIKFIEKIARFIGWDYENTDDIITNVFTDCITNNLSNQ